MWFLAVLLKPFLLFLFFLVVAFIARLIWLVMPDGRLKRLLFRRIS